MPLEWCVCGNVPIGTVELQRMSTGRDAMGKRAKEPKRMRAAAEAAGTPEQKKRDPEGLPDKQMLLIGKAIADPRRMAMLRAIAQEKATCGDLMQCTGVSAATLSHHMKELEHAGLIETTKDGRFLQATLQKKMWKSYVASLKAITG